MWLLALAACGWLLGPPPSIEEQILQAWRQEPERVGPLLQEVRDPDKRIALVRRLIAEEPAAASSLCPLLPAGAARVSCEQIAVEPARAQELLGTTADPAAAVRLSDRGAPGPSGRTTLPRQPALTPCAPGAGCDVAGAVALIEREGGAGYAEGVRRCLGLGEAAAAADCLPRLLLPLAAQAPPAEQADPEAWHTLRQSARQVRTFWEAQDADYGRLALDRLWAEAAGHAYAQAAVLVGVPLDHVPPPAGVHVRSAAALYLLQRAPEGLDLTTGAAQLRAALQVREAAAGAVGGAVLAGVRMGLALWPVDRPGEATIPAAAWPGGGRRAISATEETDTILALLEAAARLDPPTTALLQEGQGSADPLVRWTAERLLAGLGVPSQSAAR